MNHSRQSMTFALDYIQGIFGPSFFPVNEARLAAWSDQLADLTDEQLLRATRSACTHAERGQPPMPSDIRAHALGKWTVETRNSTDCHGNQTSALERFHVKRDMASGAVITAFNSKFDLVDYATQNHIASAAKVRREMPHLLPPAAISQIARENERGNGARLDDGRTDFKGMLGQ